MERVRIAVNEDFLPVLVNNLSTARKTVLLTTYKIQRSTRPNARKLMAIHKALLKAAARGVDVRILTNLQAGPNLGAHINLISARNLIFGGCQVRGLDRPRIIHAKTCIIDSERVILGSHNITNKAISSNYEVSIFFIDQYFARILEERFYKLWSISSTSQDHIGRRPGLS